MKKQRLIFDYDLTTWVFPLSFTLNLCGNDYRPWNLMLNFLCFQLVICIDEDCYKEVEDEND